MIEMSKVNLHMVRDAKAVHPRAFSDRRCTKR
jgi:hypothetical protein